MTAHAFRKKGIGSAKDAQDAFPPLQPNSTPEAAECKNGLQFLRCSDDPNILCPPPEQKSALRRPRRRGDGLHYWCCPFPDTTLHERTFSVVDPFPLNDTQSAAVFRDQTTDLRPANAPANVYGYHVSPEYLRAERTTLLAGRDFTWHDDKN